MASGKWGLVAGCAVVALTAAVVGNFAFEFLSGRQKGGSVADQFEREAARDPTLKALKQSFPEESAALQSVVVARVRAGGSEADAKDAGFRFMRAFSARHAADVAAAPTPLLVDYARTQVGFIRALRDQDAQLCAAFAFTGLGADAKLNAKSERTMRQGVETLIRAARAGHDQPVSRDKPGPADMQAVAAALMAKGVGRDRIGALANGGWRSLSPEDQCDLGVRLYDAIASLPGERAARVTANLNALAAQQLARS